jgi:microcystin-dependent protein
MGSPFLGEVRIVSFGYAPKGWAQCNGQVLPVAQHQALSTLLKNTYGGNGTSTFALPDLQGRAVVHVNDAHVLGQKAGAQTHTLTTSEVPTHTHRVNVDASAPSSNVAVATSVFANSSPLSLWGPASAMAAMHPSTVSTVGGGQPHPNEMPYLTLLFCIALQGVTPVKPT